MIRVGRLAAAIALAALAGCVVIHNHQGPQWVGKPVSALVAANGIPDTRMTSPGGVAVYVYRDTLEGDVLCAAQYYVRDGRIVGYTERGEAVNCRERVGDIR